MEKDIKVIDTLRAFVESEERLDLPFHPLAVFAEAVAMTRQESTGVSISDIAKCFKGQFDEEEIKQLIRELK